MGIYHVKQALADMPGVEGLTMRYENGGAVQVFCLGTKEARVGPMASNEEIRAALLEADE